MNEDPNQLIVVFVYLLILFVFYIKFISLKILIIYISLVGICRIISFIFSTNFHASSSIFILLDIFILLSILFLMINLGIVIHTLSMIRIYIFINDGCLLFKLEFSYFLIVFNLIFFLLSILK
jgi:hypothetical protein